MRAQAKQAGPGLDGDLALPRPSEAAGPAGPRLLIKEVTSHLGPDKIEVNVTLAYGRGCYLASAAGRTGQEQAWQLAAAAAVAAMQQYLQQHASDPSTPQVHLLDVAAHKTGIGQEFIAVIVRATNSSNHTDLLGSALVRNDRSSTAVAAALDAVSRYLGRFEKPPVVSKAEVVPNWETDLFQGEEVEPEPAPPPTAVVEVAANDFLEQPNVLESPEEEPVLITPRTERASIIRQTQTGTGFPAIGVVITPTSIQASAINEGGEILAEARRSTRGGAPPEATLSVATQAIREALSKLDSGVMRASSIGLAFPGRFANGDGLCISSGEFPTWREVQLTAPFEQEFDLPVSVLTPAQASAFAELRFGAAQGITDLLYLRVNRDIEIALIIGGQPLPLAPGATGQAGHMVVQPGGPRCACGESGCWQALAAREALVARAIKALRSGTPSAISGSVDNHFDAVTPPLIVRLAAAGDAVARKALEETGRYLALGLTNLIAIFGPQAVILESQPPSVGAALLRAAEGAMKSSPRAGLLSHCVLLSPELSDSAAALGAAAWAAACVS